MTLSNLKGLTYLTLREALSKTCTWSLSFQGTLILPPGEKCPP